MLATRALGQSALSVASITAVGKSFDRSVGVAMGVYSVLLTVFFAAAFTAVGTSVRIDGWRTAWAGVAYGLFILAAPATLLLRERPTSGPVEDDGGRAEHSFSLAEALRTPAFWVFAGATALSAWSRRASDVQRGGAGRAGFSQQIYVTFSRRPPPSGWWPMGSGG